MIKYLISEIQFTRKPEGAEIGRVNDSMRPTEGSIQDLYTSLIRGQSFTPGVCIPKRNNDNWTGAQVFALDYDSGISLDDALKTWKEVNLFPTFTYYSFSHKADHPKFRLVWIFDKFIEDIDLWRAVQKALMTIGGEDKKVIDKSCKDPARLFFGGTSGTLFSDSMISFDDHLATFENFATLSGANETRRNTRKKLRDEKRPKKRNTYYNIISNAEKRPKIEKVRNYDFELAVSRSPVLQDFVSGKRLHYPEIFGIATNMIYIEGGEKWMNSHLVKAGCYEDYHHNILPTIKNYDYHPSGIDSIDPSLIGECQNLLSLGYEMQRGKVEIINPDEAPKKKDHDDLTKQLKTAINSHALKTQLFKTQQQILTFHDDQIFMDEPPKPIHIIKAGTGVGKTEHLMHLENVLIAVPTHELKDELVTRMKEKGLDVISTPELPDFTPEVKEALETFYSTGQNKRATEELKRLASKAPTLFDSFDRDQHTRNRDSILASEYLSKLAEAHNSECTCITTTQRAILSGSQFKNKNLLIFDEDPLKTLLPTSTIQIKELLLYKSILEENLSKDPKGIQTELEFETENDRITYNEFKARSLATREQKVIKGSRKAWKSIIDMINSITSQDALVSNPVPKWMITNDIEAELVKNRTGQSILQLAHHDYMFRESVIPDDSDQLIGVIHMVKKNALPSHIPVMICSATAIEDVYTKLIPDHSEKLSFVDLGILKNQVPVIQYTGKMYSKSQITKGTALPQLSDDASVITFLRAKHRFENADEITHFFNTEGYDHLKGKHVAVVGTPLYNESYIHLIASVLGIETKGSDRAMKEYRTYTLNGMKFSCFTYADDDLAKLDIQMTLSELEQASGRARTGVTDARLEIYASIPTLTADEYRDRPDK